MNRVYKKKLLNAALIVGVMSTSTVLSFVFRALQFHESNIIMTYLIGVLMVAYFIEGYASSTIASVMGVLLFNYFFTEPYYSLTAYRQDYPITFVFMFIAGTLTSTLTIKVKQEARISYQRERRTYLLFHMSQRLLRANSEESIANVVGEDVSTIMRIPIWIAFKKKESTPFLFYSEGRLQIEKKLPAHHISAIENIYKSHMSEVVPKRFFDDETIYYVPIIGQYECLGIIGFVLKEATPILQEQKDLGIAIASQMTMAIERERLFEEKRVSTLKIESEQLKSNLLRAISHDLRTPLTGILGAIGTLVENGHLLEDVQKNLLLNNAYSDTQWLIHSVENILSMTQLEEGNVVLHKKSEFIEEIIEEVLRRSEKMTEAHRLVVDMPNELISAEIDGRLIERVLLNLIDNAVKFSPEDSVIELKVEVKVKESILLLKVIDNGVGISKEAFDKLFHRFYTTTEASDRGRRGIGLGLEICKAIIEAHGGGIRAFNNASGGATFEVSLPMRRENR